MRESRNAVAERPPSRAIGNGTGGFVGTLPPDASFGASVAPIDEWCEQVDGGIGLVWLLFQ